MEETAEAEGTVRITAAAVAMALQSSNGNKRPFSFSDTALRFGGKKGKKKSALCFFLAPAVRPFQVAMLHNEAEIFNCLNRVMIEWFSLGEETSVQWPVRNYASYQKHTHA